MIFLKNDTEFIFNDRPFCNYGDKEITYKYFKCDKCNYEYKKFENRKETSYTSVYDVWWN